MKVESAALVYFSATDTTKKVIHSIAKGFKVQKKTIVDLTLNENRKKKFNTLDDDIVIIGAPVYLIL